MAHAEICPVCNGTGKVGNVLCHGCGGRGWLEVSGPEGPPVEPMPAPATWWPPPEAPTVVMYGVRPPQTGTEIWPGT